MQSTLTTGSLTAGEAEAIVASGLMGGFFAAVGIFALVWGILGIIAGWRIFEKAGEKGWKILIPIYDVYIFYKIAGMKAWFWVSLVVSIISCIALGAMGAFNPNALNTGDFGANTAGVAFICLAVVVFALILSIVYCARLSKVFGHGFWFTLGLILLSGIFMMILGFGKSKYDKKLAKAWGVE